MATRRRSRANTDRKPAAAATARSDADAGDRTTAGARPIWSGTISFGLVAVPVHLFPAVRAPETTMRMLAPDGTPVERRFVCPEHGTDVPWDELVRGYEVDDDTYVTLTAAELEAIAPRKSRDIDLRRFVPRDELDPFLFERAYVLTPAGESTKPYRLLAAVMERERRAGIATFVMRTKEYLVAILAHDGILWAETLRLHDELRTPKQVGIAALATVTAKDVEPFVQAIRALEQEHVDRKELEDSRAKALQRLAARKARGGDVVDAPEPHDAVDPEAAAAAAPDLFETIERSLAAVQARRPEAGAGRKATKRTTVSGSAPRSASQRSRAGAGRRKRAKPRARGRTAAARSAP